MMDPAKTIKSRRGLLLSFLGNKNDKTKSGSDIPIMEFFTASINTLKVLVIALGAGLGVWGVINLLEGYGNDNPGANAHVR